MEFSQKEPTTRSSIRHACPPPPRGLSVALSTPLPTAPVTMLICTHQVPLRDKPSPQITNKNQTAINSALQCSSTLHNSATDITALIALGEQ
jgi:hypothetical protein